MTYSGRRKNAQTAANKAVANQKYLRQESANCFCFTIVARDSESLRSLSLEITFRRVDKVRLDNIGNYLRDVVDVAAQTDRLRA